MASDPFNVPTPYGDDGAFRHMRSEAAQLHEDPRAVTRELTGRLVRALTGADLDPLASD